MKITTADCVNEIENLLGEGNWKRISKKGTEIIERIFENKDTGNKVLVKATETEILGISAITNGSQKDETKKEENGIDYSRVSKILSKKEIDDIFEHMRDFYKRSNWNENEILYGENNGGIKRCFCFGEHYDDADEDEETEFDFYAGRNSYDDRGDEIVSAELKRILKDFDVEIDAAESYHIINFHDENRKEAKKKFEKIMIENGFKRDKESENNDEEEDENDCNNEKIYDATELKFGIIENEQNMLAVQKWTAIIFPIGIDGVDICGYNIKPIQFKKAGLCEGEDQENIFAVLEKHDNKTKQQIIEMISSVGFVYDKTIEDF